MYNKNYECAICLNICKDAVTLSCCSQNYCEQCIRKSLHIKKECCVCRAIKTSNDILINKNLINTIKNRFPENYHTENKNIENDNTIRSNLIVMYTDTDLIGKKVKRGLDWNHGDLSVNSDCEGTITQIDINKKCVYVKWSNKYYNIYSIGYNNKYSLIYA